MRFIRLFALFLAPVFASVAGAQTLLPGQWQTYTSMRSVNDIAIPSDSAHAWVVTGGGAYRVDLRGIGEPLLALRTTDGLTENALRSVAADANGNVYFGGSTGGFDEYNVASGTIERLGSDIRSSSYPVKSINSITIYGNIVYLATGYGISEWLPEKGYFGESINVIAGLQPDDSVVQVINTGSFVYAAMHEGVAYLPSTSDLEFGGWKLIRDTSGGVSSLASFHNSIYAGTTNGLYTISSDNQSLLTTSFPGNTPIVHLLATADTLYILDSIGTVYSTHDGQNFSAQNVSSYARSAATAISFAPNIGLIAGTAANGLAYSIAGSLQTQIFPPGPITSTTNYLHFATATDRLYETNQLAGFCLFQPSTDNWQDFEAGAGATPYMSYLYVLYDSIRNVTWFSAKYLEKVTGLETANPVWDTFNHTQNGIPNYDPTDDNFMVTGASMIDMDSNFVVTDWASNGQGITLTHDGNTFTNFTLLTPGALEPWGCVTQDFDGNYWVGTVEHTAPEPTGVYWCLKSNNGSGEIPGGSGEPLSSPEINAILTDQDDGIWCGTEVGVQIISNPEVIEEPNPSFSIRNVQFVTGQVVRTMAVDGVGNKWIGTDNGVFVVSPDGSDSIARYTSENSPLVSDAVTSIAIDPTRGEAYIGTAAGVSRFSSIYKRGNPDYSGMRVYPNPVIQTAGESPTVYVDGLVAGSTLQIFSLDGKLINTIDGTELGSTVTWNGRDALGRQVASGMYLVSATSAQSGGNGEAKVVIVRKP